MKDNYLADEELSQVNGGTSDSHKGDLINGYSNLTTGSFYYIESIDPNASYTGKAKYTGYSFENGKTLLVFVINFLSKKIDPDMCSVYVYVN